MRKGESINGGAATAYMRAVTRAEACLLASVLQAASADFLNAGGMEADLSFLDPICNYYLRP